MAFSDVLDEIKAAADALGVSTSGHGIGDGKSYEAWVLLRTIKTLSDLGTALEVRDTEDNIVDELRLRGAPGHMKPSTGRMDPQWPTHVFLPGLLLDYEVHMGLEVEGVSSATHELDISVLPHGQAKHVRATGGGPYRGYTTHAVEMKAYKQAAGQHLPMNLPRALLGTALDLDPLWAIENISYLTAGGHSRSIGLHRTRYALVTTTTLSDNAGALLQHHDVRAGEVHEPGGDETVISWLAHDIFAMLNSLP